MQQQHLLPIFGSYWRMPRAADQRAHRGMNAMRIVHHQSFHLIFLFRHNIAFYIHIKV